MRASFTRFAALAFIAPLEGFTALRGRIPNPTWCATTVSIAAFAYALFRYRSRLRSRIVRSQIAVSVVGLDGCPHHDMFPRCALAASYL